MKYRVTPSSSASAHSAVCPNQNLPILSSSFRKLASLPSECPPLSLTSLNTHATLMVSGEVTISPLWGVPGSRTLASPILYISYRSTSRIPNKPGQDQYLPQQCEEYHLAPLLFFRHQKLHHSQTKMARSSPSLSFYHYQELHHSQTGIHGHVQLLRSGSYFFCLFFLLPYFLISFLFYNSLYSEASCHKKILIFLRSAKRRFSLSAGICFSAGNFPLR